MFRKKNYGEKNKSEIINEIFSYKRELFGVTLVVFLLFLFISLVSFSPFDNCLFHFSSQSRATSNWGGIIGANLAGFIFYLLGSTAFILFALIVYFSYLLFLKISVKDELGSILGFISVIFSTSTLFFAFKIDFTKSQPGGVFGCFFSNVLNRLFGNVGFYLCLFAFLWVGLILLFKRSFLGWFVYLYRTYLHSDKLSNFGNGVKIFFLAPIRFFRIIFTKKETGKNNNMTLSDSQGSEDKFWSQIGVAKESDSDEFLKEQEALDVKVYKFRDKVVFSKYVERLYWGGKKIGAIKNSVLSNNFINIVVNLLESKPSIKLQDEIIKYKLPDISIFDSKKDQNKFNKKLIEEECNVKAKKLEEKLHYFGIEGKIISIYPGPVVTLFEYSPEIGTKISKIIALEDDLAMVLEAMSIRIIAPIPGKSAIGFEISNQTRENVSFADIVSSVDFSKPSMVLPVALGVDVAGNVVVEDLANMPHLLVAGSTGSGKSVALNVMLSSLLCKFSPENLRLILIDPKHLEFSSYKDIPHLLYPIVTDCKKASLVLKWVVGEMERRYQKMAYYGVRSLADYNLKIAQSKDSLDNVEPFIVVMIDELADMMMVAGKEVEICITRIAQMARAAGIHLIIATQRPSVDVLTGLIKVNFPSRIAFRVTSKIDSKIILDAAGAEKLLGRGDMLYLNPRSSDLQRIHGAYVSDQEIESLANYLRSIAPTNYLDLEELAKVENNSKSVDFDDDLFDDVLTFVKSVDEISISLLQRKYRIGFNRSARLIEKLEMSGIIAPSQSGKTRKVLR